LSSSPERGRVQRLEVGVMDECTPEERRDPEDVNCALARDRPLTLIFSASILGSPTVRSFAFFFFIFNRPNPLEEDFSM
jgi:hypothetical protein